MTPDETALLSARDFSFLPKDHRLAPLGNISLTLPPGRALTVLGRHGSGRMLLRDLSLGLAPEGIASGTLSLRGAAGAPRLAFLPPPSEAPFSRYGSTAAQLVRLLSDRTGLPRGAARQRLDLALSHLPQAPALDALARRPHELPPRVVASALLALAVAQEPELLIAEDPVSGLDPVEQEELLSFLAEMRYQLGFGLLYFTGDPAVAMRLGGPVLVMRDGRVIEESTAVRLATEQTHPYTRALFASVRGLRAPPAIPAARGEPLLQVRNFPLPQQSGADPSTLSFELAKGGGLALIGVHGSGRRALARAVLGLERTPKGRIVFDAVDIGALPQRLRTRLRRRIAFVSGDDTVLDPRMTVMEAVTEPLKSGVRLRRSALRRSAQAVLLRVGLADIPPRRLTSELEPVQRRRLQVARLLAAAPQLAVLYEPLAGLGALGQSIILGLLQEAKKQEGFATLLVTSDVTVAQGLAEYGMVIRDEMLIEEGPLASLVAAPQQSYTLTLVDAAQARAIGALPSGGTGG
jgi:peptide/nickel transport system ATP-binding protein